MDTRLTQPTGKRSAVAIVSSAGGIGALIETIAPLPPSFPLPIIVAQHMAPTLPSFLPAVLAWRVRLSVGWAEPGDRPSGGTVYVVPPGCALEVSPDGFIISHLPPPSRSWLGSPDRLFQSMARCYGSGAVAIVLSGLMAVGFEGLRAVNRSGGLTFAQSEKSAAFFEMPAGAIDQGRAELILSPARIAEALIVAAELEATSHALN